jgi:DNA helicase HerA-like ATPase
MGVGKSTLVRAMVHRSYALRGIPSWIIDVAGEHAPFTRKLGGMVFNLKNETFNPFILYGSDPVTTANNVAKLCTYLLGLNGKERFFLVKRIRELYKKHGVDEKDPSTWVEAKSNKINFASLYDYIASGVETGREPSIAKAVLNKIESLSAGKYRLGEGTILLENLYKAGKPVCFNLRGLPDHLQKAFVWTTLEQVHSMFYNQYEITNDLRLILVVEEAHKFTKPVEADVPSRIIEPPLSRFMREMRKMGVGLWAVTHLPSDIPPICLQGIGTLIVFGSSDAEYARFCKDELRLMGEEVDVLARMGRGECFIRYYGDARSVLVKVDASSDFEWSRTDRSHEHHHH